MMRALAPPSSKHGEVGRKRTKEQRGSSPGYSQGTAVDGEVRVTARWRRGSLTSVRAHGKGAPSSAPMAPAGQGGSIFYSFPNNFGCSSST
jgi:hypothetical protein